ncbi:hypothetical protein RclHR1_10190003 [Rhizophagus clarus]|uniref:Uncharacterized protein n=1 Tax=Rhizophagus clarus TaxID=94130 RepID=A0A2Z6QF11_9GLOM|nr:hypothetical protein RclHR1_10190003 [Rhizophagus clarus]
MFFKSRQSKQRNSWQMVKDWDHRLQQMPEGNCLLKNEDGLMKALGKTVLKDSHKEQWQVRIQDEKFKKRKIRKFKKTKKELVLDDGTVTLGKKTGPKRVSTEAPEEAPRMRELDSATGTLDSQHDARKITVLIEISLPLVTPVPKKSFEEIYKELADKKLLK